MDGAKQPVITRIALEMSNEIVGKRKRIRKAPKSIVDKQYLVRHGNELEAGADLEVLRIN